MGNLPQMRSVWTSLCLASRGKPQESDLEDLCALRGLPFRHRIPSKNVEPLTLAAALQSTRTRSGRWNKRRAAHLLGWDPDTLVARIREFGFDEPAADGPTGWDSQAVLRAMRAGARERDL